MDCTAQSAKYSFWFYKSKTLFNSKWIATAHELVTVCLCALCAWCAKWWQFNARVSHLCFAFFFHLCIPYMQCVYVTKHQTNSSNKHRLVMWMSGTHNSRCAANNTKIKHLLSCQRCVRVIFVSNAQCPKWYSPAKCYSPSTWSIEEKIPLAIVFSNGGCNINIVCSVSDEIELFMLHLSALGMMVHGVCVYAINDVKIKSTYLIQYLTPSKTPSILLIRNAWKCV